MARDAGQSTLLGVFARYWQPGQAKTRLAAKIGEEAAARLHRLFVETTLSRLACPETAAARWLAVTPADSLGQFQPLAAVSRHSWEVLPQEAGDLGRRMEHFFRRALKKFDRAILLGSDSPDLPRPFVAAAFRELTAAPVVLGPAADGGYYLIGLSASFLAGRWPSTLWDEMPWSSPRLLTETLRRVVQCGLDYRLLPEFRDVDQWEDLVALHGRLGNAGSQLEAELKVLRDAVAEIVAGGLRIAERADG
jgi:hypothetical protein